VTQKMTFILPERLDIETGTHVTENGTFRYESNVDSSSNTVTIVHSLRALRDSVPVGDVPDHLTKLNDIWDNIGYSMGPGRDTTAAGDIRRALDKVPGWGWATIGVVILVAFCVFFAVPRRRTAGRLATVHRLRASAFGPGEAPASALAVRDADELHARLASIG